MGRLFVAGLTFLGMLLKKQCLGPRNLQVAIPSGCDHACEFCITDIHGMGAAKNRDVLGHEEITKQIDSALSILCLNINLVSTGEPTLYPRLTDLIDHIWRRSRGRASVKIVTNGSSLWRFDPQYLKSRNVVLWLSLHSGDEKNWRSIHRPLTQANEKFEKMKRWLSAFNRLAPGRVTLHSVITKQNMSFLPSILEFARETGCRDVFFGRLYGFPQLQLSSQEERQVLQDLTALEREFKAGAIKTNIESFRFVAISQADGKDSGEAAPSDEPLSSRDFYRSHDCYISWLFSTVDDVGQVLACGKGRLIGNTREHDYGEIFLNEAPRLIRETTSISARGTNVSGCHCQDCPHIQMNALANRYVRWVKR